MLLLAIVVGLLVGHWVTQSKAPSQQVLKVEGLSASAPLAARRRYDCQHDHAAASTIG